MILLLVACAGALLPEERVLGDEVSAVVLEGTAGSGFGSAVAIGEDTEGDVHVLVGAPDAGLIQAFDTSGELIWSVSGESGLGTRVGWQEGLAWAWAPGTEVVLDVEESGGVASAPSQATAVAVCPDGEILMREGKGEYIECTESGRIWTSCEDTVCEVVRADSTLDGVQTSSGSVVGFWGAEACMGDAQIGLEESSGRVRCEDGSELQGKPGDHLGLAIAGGRVAGVFNRHLQPPRARILSLDGDVTWAVDRAAERSRIALASGPGLVAVGVPGFGASQAREGRVYLVQVSP